MAQPAKHPGSMERASGIASLSPREREIARAYAAGGSYRNIAEQMFIAPSTVRTHLRTIYHKLGLSSKGDLLRLLASAEQDSRSVANIAPASAGSSIPIQWKHESQRRQVTVLCADMVGSTQAAERLGEEASFDLMRQIIGRMKDVVAQHRGAIQSLTGDGMIALFGAPVAIENAPLQACRAALAFQASMREFESICEDRYGVRPKFRVGIHTGPLVIGGTGDADPGEFIAVGTTINLSARLQSEAETGSIVMSEATHRLIHGFAATEFLGMRKVKGASAPLRIYRIDGLKESVSRFDLALRQGLTDFVGRSSELGHLRRNWTEARRRALRIVNITGEAGIGKTRLVHEFRPDPDEGEAHVHQGRCTAQDQSTPFRPFIDIVRASFRVSADMPLSRLEPRLRHGLALLGIEQGELLPYLLNILGHASDKIQHLDPEVIGIRTRDAFRRLMRERHRMAPAVFFIDDAQWIDRASEELITRICREDADLPLLFLFAYRPEYVPPWKEFDNALEIRLGQLSASDTAHLLRKRLRADKVPEELLHLISGKSEGNPLFAEEILNYLIETSAVETMEAAVLFSDAVGGDLPASLENLLMERVDRLDDGPRATLEMAAVIGSSFPRSLLQSATAADALMLDNELEEMRRKDLIVSESDGKHFRFKHVLLRDAVYSSILSKRRRAMHERIAEAILHSYAAGPPADLLAWHYSQSANDERAVHYLAAAGRRSLTVFSLPEAEANFKRALERADRNPGCLQPSVLLDVLLGLFRVLQLRMKNYEIIELAERYRPLVERTDDSHGAALFLFWLGTACVNAGQRDTGQPTLERALAIGEEAGDEVIIGYAAAGLLWLHLMWDDFAPESRERVLEYSEVAHRLGLAQRNDFLVSTSLLGSAVHLTIMGRPGESRRHAMRLIEYGRTTDDPRPRIWGLLSLALTNAVYFEQEEAIANADDALSIGPCPVDRTTALGYRGMAQAGLERWHEALPALQEVHARCTEGGMLSTLVGPEFALGASMIAAGDGWRGIRVMKDWRKRLQVMNCVWGEGYFHLHMGEVFLRIALGGARSLRVALRRGDWWLLLNFPLAARRARMHLEMALGYYRSHEMPALLGWSLMNLGHLHLQRKRFTEARICLDEARALAAISEEPGLGRRIEAIAARLPAATR